MSRTAAWSITEPSATTKTVAAVIVILYALIALIPLIWIGMTAFKSASDSISYPPKLIFEPSLEGYCSLLHEETLPRDAQGGALAPAPAGAAEPAAGAAPMLAGAGTGLCDRVIARRGLILAGPSNFLPRFGNSLIIAFGSTFLSVLLGTLAAYGFSRFKVPLKDDLLFFILSTRFMPPIAVAIPIFLMYREVGLSDTAIGMILLYTAVNVSLAVWLLKGFIDEIPREYEEAALIDGYTRLQAFRRVVLPQATTGIVATAIFCLIFAWNEYAFAVLLTSGQAQTAPPFIPTIIGFGGQDWPAVAFGTVLFLLPILVFTIALRKHLLRGITFGAVRK